MKIRQFSKDDYPAIVNIHTSLNISWPEQPRTPDGWFRADQNRNPKLKFQRWVAVKDSQVVGFGNFAQSSYDYHPLIFNINVEVSPSFQNQGFGSALYQQILNGLKPFNPRILRADAFTNLLQGIRFLNNRGFYEAFRETTVQLDVTSFDASPYLGLEMKLAKKGIVIKTLQKMEIDPYRDRKLYDLYWDVSRDQPHEGVEIEKQEFDEWLDWGIYDPVVLPDAYFIAVRGDEYIGLRELGKDPDSDVLLGGLLGVRRGYRRQGIGLALQLRGISYAKTSGYSELKTCTARVNHPMQKLFDKLGYVRGPEWLQCQKDLRDFPGQM